MSTEQFEPNRNDDLDDASRPMARRGAIAVAAGGIVATAAAAVSGLSAQGAAHAPSRRPAPATPAPAQPAPSDADLMIGALAASLEVLAVNTYQAALDAAGAGALGAVPPAVAEYVTTARDQHQAHLDAWNEVLTGAGRPAVTAPPPDLAASVNEQFGMVTDVAGAAQLALMLEQVAADTYLSAIGQLQAPAAIELAGSIFTIDRQHQSVLLFALGMYPVPEVFANVDMAYSGTGGMPAGQLVPATK